MGRCKGLYGLFFDEYFAFEDKLDEKFAKEDIINILSDYKASSGNEADQNEWFENVKAISEKYNFCTNMKEYKANPDAYKGNVADVSSFIRVAVTGKLNSPDLFAVEKLLGKEKVNARIDKFIKTL